jgi:hypothetical protein
MRKQQLREVPSDSQTRAAALVSPTNLGSKTPSRAQSHGSTVKARARASTAARTQPAVRSETAREAAGRAALARAAALHAVATEAEPPAEPRSAGIVGAAEAAAAAAATKRKGKVTVAVRSSPRGCGHGGTVGNGAAVTTRSSRQALSAQCASIERVLAERLGTDHLGAEYAHLTHRSLAAHAFEFMHGQSHCACCSVRFLVRWRGRGASADSWEPEAAVDDKALIRAFRREQPGAATLNSAEHSDRHSLRTPPLAADAQAGSSRQKRRRTSVGPALSVEATTPTRTMGESVQSSSARTAAPKQHPIGMHDGADESNAPTTTGDTAPVAVAVARSSRGRALLSPLKCATRS